jgi:glycosyltransferase involved in cell wall biosynthesis
MRISVYIDSLNFGGAEILLLNILTLLKSKGYKISVITLKGNYTLEKKFSNIFMISKKNIFSFFLDILRSDSIGYIHLSKATLISCIACNIRKLLNFDKRIFFIHEHTSFHYHSNRKYINKKIFDFFYKKILLFSLKRGLVNLIVSTKARYDEVSNFNKNNSIIYIFPNSFLESYKRDLIQTNLFNKTEFLEGNVITLATISRIERVKQIEWAILSANSLANNYKKKIIKLIIVGTGTDTKRLKKLSSSIKKNNLQIIFNGFAENTIDIFKKIDFFLFPSLNEGFPLGLTEAAMTGISCIANDCEHGPKEIANHFPNVNLVSPANYINFEDKIYSQVKLIEKSNINNSKNIYNAINSWPSLESIVEKFHQDVLQNYL